MTRLPGSRRVGVMALLSTTTLAGAVLYSGIGTTPDTRNHPTSSYPNLFVDEVECPHRGSALAVGRRSEEHARMRADRYPYDPRDGVRAVRNYQTAESCYKDSGDELGVHRARRAILALTTRVNTDYAAARLNLFNALEQEQWSVALSEIRRLLLLTDHIRRHEYVEWLDEIIGRVAANASTES